MTTGKHRETLRLDTQQSPDHSDWLSEARPSERDVVRMGWARHVLEEESRYPLTHSAARIRRAKNILATHQNNQF